MQFIFKKGPLKDELSRLQGVVDRGKNKLPILEAVKIESLGGKRLRLSATNLETTVMTELVADQVDVPGKVCVQARKLYELVNLLPQDALATFTVEANDHVRVRSKGSNIRIPGMSSFNFPELPAVDGVTWLELPGKQVKGLLAGVDHSIPNEEHVQFLLKGIKVEIEGMDIRMVTTDGHRLSLASSALPTMMREDLDILLPHRGVNDVTKILSDYVGDIGIAANDNHIFFRAGSRLLCTRKLIGEFPDYTMIFANSPKEYECRFKASDLAQAVKRAVFVSDPDKQTVSLNFEGGKLYLRASTAESGEADESLDSDFNGSNMRIDVNGRYLLDALEAVGGSTVLVEMSVWNKPLHISTEREGIDYRFLVMPVDQPRA